MLRRVWILVCYWTCSLAPFTHSWCGNCRPVSIWIPYTLNFCSPRKSASCLWLNMWPAVWNKWGLMCPWFVCFHKRQVSMFVLGKDNNKLLLNPTHFPKKDKLKNIQYSVYKTLRRSQVQSSIRIHLFMCTLDSRRIKTGRKHILANIWEIGIFQKGWTNQEED